MAAAVPSAPGQPESRGRPGTIASNQTHAARAIQLSNASPWTGHHSTSREDAVYSCFEGGWMVGVVVGVEASSRNKGKTWEKFAFNNRIHRSRKVRNTLYNIGQFWPFTNTRKPLSIVRRETPEGRRNRAVHIKTVCSPNPVEYHASIIPTKAVTKPERIRKRSDEMLEGWQMGGGRGLGTYCLVQAFCGFCRDYWNGCHGGVLQVTRKVSIVLDTSSDSGNSPRA